MIPSKNEWISFFDEIGFDEVDSITIADKFVAAKIRKESVSSLNDDCLLKIGINVFGDRKLILDWLKSARKRPLSAENKDLLAKKLRQNIGNDPSSDQITPTTSATIELPLTRDLQIEMCEHIEKYFEHKEHSKDKMNAALWTLSIILPKFSILEHKYVDLLDKVSLVALRNRIEFLEIRFMIGDKDVDDLLKALKYDKSEVDRISTKVMQKVNKTTTIAELSTATANIIYQDTAKLHQQATTSNEPPLSAPIVRKSSSHYFRWKYAFKFCDHLSDLKKIKDFVKSNNLSEEEFFIEVAYLFTVASNIGIHVVVPNAGKESVKRSLRIYNMNEQPVLTTVDALYCTLV